MGKNFAVVKIGGRQYKVSVGDQFDIEKEEGKKGDKLTFNEVLLTSKKGKISLGTPTLKGDKVEAKILDQKRGKKVRILKYKAKSRYRRRKGHRQEYTRIEITKI
jgi:large subunit ribosomal protein L21